MPVPCPPDWFLVRCITYLKRTVLLLILLMLIAEAVTGACMVVPSQHSIRALLALLVLWPPALKP